MLKKLLRQSQILKINNKIEYCKLCEISKEHYRGIGYGNIYSKIMFVAINPGFIIKKLQTKDVSPFGLWTESEKNAKHSGIFFRKFLKKLNMTKEDFYITNLVKCPTYKNRPVFLNEIQNCNRYLEQEIQLMKPKLVVALGQSAAASFNIPIHNKVIIKNAVYYISIWHPAYILRNNFLFDKWLNNFKEAIKKID
jgi:DNA polymerase